MKASLGYFVRPDVVKADIGVANLPRALEGRRIAFATDIHTSWMFPARALERLLNQIDSLKPDLILWGGDYAENMAGQRIFFSRAARLKPPMGMAAVVGNNDAECFCGDIESMRRMARASGITLLNNETRDFVYPDGRLRLIGLDDPKYGAPDLRLLKAPRVPGEARIVMIHSPAPLAAPLDAPPDGCTDPDLYLCGHTHGGQIALGRLNPYSLGYDQTRGLRDFYISGTHKLGGARLVVSNGVGTSLLPLRVGAPAQIHLFALCRTPEN